MSQTEDERLIDACEDGGPSGRSAGLKLMAQRDEARRALTGGTRPSLIGPADTGGQCTGVSARWCPRCGVCTCREPDQFDASDDFGDPKCPLHRADSRHALVTDGGE